MSKRIKPDSVHGIMLASFAGLSDEDAFRVHSYAVSAANYFSKMLVSDEYAECEEVIYAAACLAYRRICISNFANSGASTFKAGDITVSQKAENVLKAADLLLADAIEGAASYLQDINFTFKGI